MAHGELGYLCRLASPPEEKRNAARTSDVFSSRSHSSPLARSGSPGICTDMDTYPPRRNKRSTASQTVWSTLQVAMWRKHRCFEGKPSWHDLSIPLCLVCLCCAVLSVALALLASLPLARLSSSVRRGSNRTLRWGRRVCASCVVVLVAPQTQSVCVYIRRLRGLHLAFCKQRSAHGGPAMVCRRKGLRLFENCPGHNAV